MANLFARNDQYKVIVNEGVWMDVKDPSTGYTFGTRSDDGVLLPPEEQRPSRIKLLGYDSEKVQAALKMFQQKMYVLYKRDGDYEPTQEELDAQAVAILVAATIDWQNIDGHDGSPLSCTAINVRVLYENVNWVRQQADRFINDKKNYGKKDGEVLPSLDNKTGQLIELEKKSSDGPSGDVESISA